MTGAPMIKKSNFMASQGKEDLPTCETVTVFTEAEIERFKAECFRCYGSGKRIYNQAAAYVLMLNTGLREGELLGHSTSQITEMYYVKKDTKRLQGITDGFDL